MTRASYLRAGPRASVAVVLLVLLLYAMMPRRAEAHGELVRSDPEPGAILVAAPGEVRLWFSEPLILRVSDAGVWDQDGRRVDRGSSIAPDDPQELVVALPSLLAGSYTVSWRSVSPLDGHILRGQVSFIVGTNPAGGETFTTTDGLAWTAQGGLAAVGAHWLTLLAALTFFGAVVFQRFVLSCAARPATAHRTQVLIQVIALALAVGAIGSVAAQAVTLADGELGTSPDGSILRPLLFGSRAGIAAIGQLILAVVSGGIVRIDERASTAARSLVLVCHDRALLVQLGLTLAVLGTVAWSGHATSGAAPSAVSILADGVHLVGAGVWVGGMVFVGLVLIPSEFGWSSLLPALSRFSPYALASLGLLGVTGLVSARIHVGSVALLLGSLYGRLLLGKVLLVGALVLMSGWQDRILRPRLARQLGRADRGRDDVESHLARSLARWLRLEAVIGAGVVLLVALLAAFPVTPTEVAHANDMALRPAPTPRSDLPLPRSSATSAVIPATTRTPNLVSTAAPVPPASATPPPFDAMAVLHRVDQAMNQLTALHEENRLGLTEDGPNMLTVYDYVAPDRMRFRQDSGADTIAVGTWRYDRAPSAPWNVSPWPDRQGFRWPIYHYARNASDVSMLHPETLDGEPVLVVTYVDRTFSGRYTLWIGVPDYRIRQERMAAPGHFMLSRYSGYDTPLVIDPPR